MSHQHSASCTCSEDQKQSDAITTSVYPSIDRERIWCLNEAEPNMGQKCIKPWASRNDGQRLLSDPDDGELLLFIPFITAVHIKTITIMAWSDWQPKKIKMYVNRDDLDLSSVHDTTCTQEIELSEDADGFIDYPVKLNKFQNVNSLLIFVPESVTGGQSGIQYINLKGVSTQNKREVVNVVYESRANPADHAKLTESSSSSMMAGLIHLRWCLKERTPAELVNNGAKIRMIGWIGRVHLGLTWPIYFLALYQVQDTYTCEILIGLIPGQLVIPYLLVPFISLRCEVGRTIPEDKFALPLILFGVGGWAYLGAAFFTKNSQNGPRRFAADLAGALGILALAMEAVHTYHAYRSQILQQIAPPPPPDEAPPDDRNHQVTIRISR